MTHACWIVKAHSENLGMKLLEIHAAKVFLLIPEISIKCLLWSQHGARRLRMKKMSNASRRCHQRADQLKKVRYIPTKHSPCFQSMRDITRHKDGTQDLALGRRNRRPQGGRGGRVCSAWAGRAWASWPEQRTLKRVMRVKGSRALSVQGLQQQLEDSVVGGFARSPRRQEDWKAKGGCEEDSRKTEGKD